VAALVEGNSISSTVRMSGVSKNTIMKLLASLGVACADYQDRTLRNLRCRRVRSTFSATGNNYKGGDSK
jgi:hypothetical protein